MQYNFFSVLVKYFDYKDFSTSFRRSIGRESQSIKHIFRLSRPTDLRILQNKAEIRVRHDTELNKILFWRLYCSTKPYNFKAQQGGLNHLFRRIIFSILGHSKNNCILFSWSEEIIVNGQNLVSFLHSCIYFRLNRMQRFIQ